VDLRATHVRGVPPKVKTAFDATIHGHRYAKVLDMMDEIDRESPSVSPPPAREGLTEKAVLSRLLDEFEARYGTAGGDIGLIEVRRWLETRHVHWPHTPECQHHYADQWDIGKCVYCHAPIPVVDPGFAPAERPERPPESPILAFQAWAERRVPMIGRAFTHDEYTLAQAAFIAAHPGEGPRSDVMAETPGSPPAPSLAETSAERLTETRDSVVMAWETGRGACIDALRRAVARERQGGILPLTGQECVQILESVTLDILAAPAPRPDPQVSPRAASGDTRCRCGHLAGAHRADGACRVCEGDPCWEPAPPASTPTPPPYAVTQQPWCQHCGKTVLAVECDTCRDALKGPIPAPRPSPVACGLCDIPICRECGRCHRCTGQPDAECWPTLAPSGAREAPVTPDEREQLHALLQAADALIDPEEHGDLHARIVAVLLPCAAGRCVPPICPCEIFQTCDVCRGTAREVRVPPDPERDRLRTAGEEPPK